ncbi:hypothetical protein QQM79_16680 [Marinobacteraceae bacterium S3BR75-40.1]
MSTGWWDRIKREWGALAAMPQNPVTVMAPIAEEREAELRDHLATVAADSSANGLLPLGLFEDRLHFARFLILEGPDHPDQYGSRLVFLANVDGAVDRFLEQLVDKTERGIDTLFAACVGYPAQGHRSRAARLAYLQNHLVRAQTYYINTLGRTARQIHEEDHLHQALENLLDRMAPEHYNSARQLRQALVEHVAQTPDLSWALEPAHRPGWLWRAKEQVRFVVVLGLGGMALVWSWPLLVGWVVLLQLKEQGDPEDSQRPPLERLQRLRADEDLAVHNQFSAVGYLKPGWVRRMTARGVLAAAQLAVRHVFNRGDLAGVPLLGLDGVDTIHFARWIMIDDDRRLLFASNYDGSLESYMVDFIDKVSWGLNVVFSNGRGYPRTRWLFFQGAKNEQRFKDYIGNHQIVTHAWHAPYQHLTAVNIANNEAIRSGLRGRMGEKAAQAWLARL